MNSRLADRLRRHSAPSLRWGTADGPSAGLADVSIDCGWGRLIFAHTFAHLDKLTAHVIGEADGKRDMAFYVRDPHVVLAMAPQDLFLDPSHTYRLNLAIHRPAQPRRRGFHVRLLQSYDDAVAINRVYKARGMVEPGPDFIWERRKDPVLSYFVAEDGDGNLLGTVMGVDHVPAFEDAENGSSLWCLAVDPRAQHPGIGEALVQHLADFMMARGRSYMDLSVMHTNAQAIALYEKLGFQRVPVFCVKRKNPINRALFIGPHEARKLNPYAQIIIDEALRRGIRVEVQDVEAAMFVLEFGGRQIRCRESLTDLTSAVVLSRCDDKRLTHKFFHQAGLRVPAMLRYANQEAAHKFLEQHGSVVVKPTQGEQGRGISVDVRTRDELDAAIKLATESGNEVLIEEYVQGDDLRIVVIDYEVVAAAIRKPATIVGTGEHTVRKLIEKTSRRRAAATGGESTIPMDDETWRCVGLAGWEPDDVPPPGEQIRVRRTANLHTGGTLHDVTERLHPALAEAAIEAARTLEIPVTGLDMIVSAADQPDYVLIEANERPGLANHEPQPTAARFIDLLFPETTQAAA